MRYYTPSRLSEHISETPEGFLVCPGVAIARTGSQRYLPDEVPEDIAAGLTADEEVLVYRPESEVFSPRTLASFEGKPLTIDHPDEDVTPENWAELAAGHVQNVRGGNPDKGQQPDLVYADIVITRADAIDAVRNGLRELSCGYDAEYEAIRPGVGRQIHITGNHVALVEHGRAGARCRINDRAARCADGLNNGETFMAKGQGTNTLTGGAASASELIAKAAGASGFTPARMETPPKRSWLDRIMGNPKVRAAVRDAEAEEAAKNGDQDTPAAEQEKADTPVQTGDEGDPVQAGLEEIKLMLRTLVEALKPTAPAEPASDEELTGDDAPVTDNEPEPTSDDEPQPACDEDDPPARTGDRARYADADTVRRARLIAPHLACRVGDSAAAVRRMALDSARRDPVLARVIDSIAGSDIARAGQSSQRAAFMAASELAAERNNRRTGDALTRAKGRDGGAVRPVTPADINKMNAEYYGKRG